VGAPGECGVERRIPRTPLLKRSLLQDLHSMRRVLEKIVGFIFVMVALLGLMASVWFGLFHEIGLGNAATWFGLSLLFGFVGLEVMEDNS
jgi:hypothetical protein